MGSNSSGRPRWWAALLAVVALLTTATAIAGPAAAFPPDTWWYGQLSIAKSHQVSTGQGVTVAVLDTGVKASLGDLRGQVLPGISFVGGNPRDDIPTSADKYDGHGSEMASYIAGTGRGAGLVGVAPGAKIMPVRDASNGSGAVLDAMVNGIVWATQHGAKIINVSEAGQLTTCPAAVQKSVDYAVSHDVIVVASTGNAGGTAIGFPANCVGAIAVGGLAYSGQFRPWSGSTYGPALDFVAPAEHLKALLLDDTISQADGTGTSAAAAFVSGTFALLRSKFPHDSARQIVTRALYNVHNGLGGKVFAKRVDDQLGYGEILPSYALTQAPPANAVNPIYDAIEKHLRTTSPSASPSPSASAPSGSAAATPVGQSGSGGSGGPSPILIVVLIVVVVGIVIVVVAAVRRSRRLRRTSSHGSFGPPPPGQYGSGY